MEHFSYLLHSCSSKSHICNLPNIIKISKPYIPLSLQHTEEITNCSKQFLRSKRDWRVFIKYIDSKINVFSFFYCRCRWVLLEEPFYPTVKKRYNTSSIFYRSLTSDTIIHFCLLQPSMKHIHLNYTILGKLNKPRVNYVSHKRFFLSFGAENDYVSCETCNNVKCVYFGFHVEFLYYMQNSFSLSSAYLWAVQKI